MDFNIIGTIEQIIENTERWYTMMYLIQHLLPHKSTENK